MPFLARLDRPKISYQCFILKSDAVNAFSAPGGYIYVCQGLFDLIAEDEDDALEFAIGHEIAHVDLKHAITCLVDPDVKRMPLGTVQKLFWSIIPRGYLVIDKVDHKVDQELDADQWVLKRMRRFPRSRREILKFLNKFEGYAENNGFPSGRAKPLPKRGISPLENHYRSQTAAQAIKAHERAHRLGPQRHEMIAATAAKPISIEPSAIASALGPIRFSELAGNRLSTRSWFNEASVTESFAGLDVRPTRGGAAPRTPNVRATHAATLIGELMPGNGQNCPPSPAMTMKIANKTAAVIGGFGASSSTTNPKNSPMSAAIKTTKYIGPHWPLSPLPQ